MGPKKITDLGHASEDIPCGQQITALDDCAAIGPFSGTVSVARERKTMAQSHLKLVTPATVKRTVVPRRRPNADLRTGEYLTEAEIERVLRAAKGTVGAIGTPR